MVTRQDPHPLAFPALIFGNITLAFGPWLVRRPAEKQALGETHKAMALDGESFAVAQLCQREKIRFLAVRIINEALQDELPQEVQRVAGRKTQAARCMARLPS